MNSECPCGQPVWKMYEDRVAGQADSPHGNTVTYQHGTDDEQATCHAVNQNTSEIYDEFVLLPDPNPMRFRVHLTPTPEP